MRYYFNRFHIKPGKPGGGVHRQCTDPGPVVVSFFYLVHLKIKLVQGTRLGVGIWKFSSVPVRNWYQVLIWIQFLQNWIFVIGYSVYYDPPHCWCMYPNDDTMHDISCQITAQVILSSGYVSSHHIWYVLDTWGMPFNILYCYQVQILLSSMLNL